MATIIRDKIKQPDGKDFKLLDAIDVEHNYTDGDGNDISTSVKEYLDSLTSKVEKNTSDITSLGDTYYTEGEVDEALAEKADKSYVDDAVSKVHDHGNKDVLDGISEGLVNTWNQAAENLGTHTSDTKIHVTEAQKTAWDSKSDFDGKYESLTGTPDISTMISDAITPHTDDESIHVTAAQKAEWDAKSGFDGNYSSLTGVPDIDQMISDAVTPHTTDADIHVTKADKEGWTSGISGNSGKISAIENYLTVDYDATFAFNDAYVESLVNGTSGESTDET